MLKNSRTGVEIAVVGMSCKFPGAGDTEEFWRNLQNGVCSVRFFSDEEILEESGDAKIADPAYVRANACLQDKEYFDAAFFGYIPSEAALMDPQSRLFHEQCWKALEDAGIDVYSNKERIGLFAGASTNINWMNYAFLANRNNDVEPFAAAQLRDAAFMCSRVSYLLNLQGPSIFVNTACSTSLVAVQRACISLLVRECKVAVAGGVHLNNFSKRGYVYREGMIFSKDGYCRAFDADASGTIGGEGAGVVVLKRLEDALADGDNIHAVIIGHGINNDGSDKASYTAPSVDGQYQAILKALRMAGADPNSIGFVEAHGTGTPLGDPIETEALKLAFGKSESRYCALGSVKTNIGHLDTAAGVAGLIKTILSLKHKQIAPSLHFKTLNPKIDLSGSPFFVNTVLRDWERGEGALRAGVSSFGIGGTNVHLILEEAPAPVAEGRSSSGELLLLSARTPAALQRNAQVLAGFLRSHPDLRMGDVAYTLQHGRAVMPYRKAILAGVGVEAGEQLTSEPFNGKYVAEDGRSRRIVFMFPGQGAQFTGMCHDLYEEEEYFRHQLDNCFEILRRLSGEEVKQVLFDKDLQDRLNETVYTQPLLFCVEYALARSLMHLGILPSAMIGHSIGEYVAACLSGIMGLEDALLIVWRRGQLMQATSPGKMLHVPIREELLHPILQGYDGISLAAINCENACVVAGEADRINLSRTHLEGLGHKCTLLRTTRAFHSELMDPVLAEFEEVVRSVTLNKAAIPVVSNVTGEWLRDAEGSSPRYWSRHLRSTVKFSAGIDTLLHDGNMIFVEVGPGRALSGFVRGREHLPAQLTTVTIVRHPVEQENDRCYFLKALGQLWMAGLQPDWRKLSSPRSVRTVSLPSYVFEKTSYPVLVDSFRMIAGMSKGIAANTVGEVGLFVPVWEVSDHPSGVRDAESYPVHVILSGHNDLAADLTKRIMKRGGSCLRIDPDSKDTQLGDLDPSVPLRIIFTGGLAAVGGDDLEVTDLRESLDVCYFPLLDLARSLNRLGMNQRIELISVSRGMHAVVDGDRIHPEKAPLQAALKAIARENKNIVCRNLDVSSSADSQELLDVLFEEMGSPDGTPFVAYRHGTRYVEAMRPMSQAPAGREPEFVRGGVYLITGGTGGMGFAIAERLVKEIADVTLILVGRQREAAIAPQLRQLEGNGATVYYIAENISNAAALRTAIHAIEEEKGSVNGVIHAAGVADLGGVIYRRTREACEKVFESKLYGTLALTKVLKPEELDFFVLCSSMSRLAVPFGEVAYIAANGFLDAYARYCVQHLQLPITSVCWNTWQETGMAVRASERDPDRQRGVDTLDPGEGYAVLKKAIQTRMPELLVSRLPLMDPAATRRILTGNYRPEEQPKITAGGAQGEQGTIKERLLEAWKGFFGKEVAEDDNFFEIGGDSLKAVTMIGKIHWVSGIELSLATFFRNPSVRQLDLEISRVKRLQSGEIMPERAPLKPAYKASSAQKRLYFLQEFDKGSLAYNITEVYRLEGPLDRNKLNRAFKQLILRHESLRTTFHIIDGELHQEIGNGANFEIAWERAADVHAAATAVSNKVRPFDLHIGPLMRVALIDISPSDHVLLIDLHHIVADGISQNILIRDFMTFYSGDTPADVTLQYKDFTEWQSQRRQDQAFAIHREFWLRQFEDFSVAADLPMDQPRPAVRNHGGASLDWELDEGVTGRLKAVGASSGATLYMVLLSVLKVMMAKLTNLEDVVVGTPLSGRSYPGTEEIIGMFVNTVVLRSYPLGNMTFSEFLSGVKDLTLACFDHQLYPYESLIKDLNIDRDTRRTPLFNVMFSFQNFDRSELRMAGLTLTPLRCMPALSKFDLNLMAMERDGALHFSIEYATDLFSEETIARFAGYYKNIINTVAIHEDVRLSEIDLLPLEEEDRLLAEFSSGSQEPCPYESIVSLFERQVDRAPDHIAVITDGDQLTYAVLNGKVNRLAWRLIRDYEVRPNDIIGVLLPKNENLLIGILAILKAGAAYVPIDIKYPEERIRHMATNSGLKGMITNGELERKAEGVTVIRVDEEVDQGQEERSDNPGLPGQPDDLFYVLYTSGSTGAPKGVMIKAGPFMNLIRWYAGVVSLGPSDRVLIFSAVSFDLTQKNFFAPLVVGASIYLSDRLYLDYPGTANVIDAFGITILNMAPSAFYPLLEPTVNDQYRKLRSVRAVVLGGEQVHCKELYKWSRSPFYRATFVNAYGPTEATDVNAHHVLTAEDLSAQEAVSIGKPIPNTYLYILDRYGRLLPQGVAGEICIGGYCLAAGYLNAPALTEEKFVRSVFHGGQKIYRTGDLGKWMANGSMKYLGRLDNQIKLRGHRIELQEIEVQLRRHEAIGAAVVVKLEREGDEFLAGYFVASAALTGADLRSYLLSSLPEYMVPAYFVQLERFELTPSGKIDRKRLPFPQIDVLSDYTPPEGPVETALVRIWAQVLKVEEEKISVTANFFSIGGHSLSAINLLARIEKEFGVKVSLSTFFGDPTIRRSLELLGSGVRVGTTAIPKAAPASLYRASSAQKRLYFLYELDKGSIAYNLQEVVRLRGPLDKERLLEAFRRLIQRHESLRTSFVLQHADLFQRVSEEVDLFIEMLSPEQADLDDRIKEFVRPFDLEKGPLIRVGLICERPEEYVLVIDMHHIISDGLSQVVLLKELMTLYRGERLTDLRLQYKDYAEWQQSDEQQALILGHREYWLRELTTELPDLRLPVDYTRPVLRSYTGATADLILDKELAGLLKQLAASSGVTLSMVLLAVYAVMLSKLSGQEDLIIGVPTAGREHADLEGIIGMFVNTLPARLFPTGERGFRDFLAAVRTTTLACYDHQSYPYEVLIDDLKLERNASRNPLFDVLFVFQNFDGVEQHDTDIVTEPYRYIHPGAKFDLSLAIAERNGALYCCFEYATDLFEAETVHRFTGYFRNIAVHIATAGDGPLSGIDMLPEDEKEKLLFGFNQTRRPYPCEETIVSLFRRQVEKSPEAVAVRTEQGKALTYWELWSTAVQISHYLHQEKGVRKGDFCLVMLVREEMLLPAIFGVLMAGAAYIPVDPILPPYRIQTIAEDAKPKVIISRSEHMTGLPGLAGTSTLLLDRDMDPISRYSTVADGFGPDGNTPAYVIYTSGSTGTPKGVVIAHHSILNRLLWAQRIYPITASDVVLQKTPLMFDVSVQELFWWAFAGGSLCLLRPGGEKDPMEILDAIARYKVTVVHFVPSMLDAFLGALSGESASSLAGLRVVLSSGEELLPRQVRAFGGKVHSIAGCRLINLYGPTEATVDVSYYECGCDEDVEMVPIGRPIDNTQLYVLDRHLNVVPVGVPGELHIGGVGLAIGYLGNESMTKEKFITFSISAGHSERIYKTGDLARWLPTGNIEYLGRLDHQLKLRGYRIETGEIENMLLLHGAVEKAVVAPVPAGGEQVLVAYYVSALELDDLGTFLSCRLPQYMIPSFFVRMDDLPLTANGKLNRKALPVPGLKTNKTYQPAGTPLEQLLVKLWAEILRTPESAIGIHDSFFEAGGHSLRAVHLVNKVKETAGVRLSLREVFSHSTIAGLASLIPSKKRENGGDGLYRVETAPFYACSSEQERFYYDYLAGSENLLNNISCAYRIVGVVDVQRIRDTFNVLVKRHESLRTSFFQVKGTLKQRVHASCPMSIGWLDAGAGPSMATVMAKFRRPFDLREAPLFRAALFQADNGDTLLLVDIHHIICDGMSLNLLMDEFKSIYKGKVLPDPEWRYIDYAGWQKKGWAGLQEDRQYWQEQLAGELRVIDLPVLKDRAAVRIGRAATHSVRLPEEVYEKLLQFNARTGNTEFITLLAIFYILIARITGSRDLVIGIDAAGRTLPEMQRVIGTFVNILPIRVGIGEEDSFLGLADRIKEVVLKGLEHQQFQFEQMVKLVNRTEGSSRTPIVSIHFSMNNTMEAGETLDEVGFHPVDITAQDTTQYELKAEVRKNGSVIDIAFIYSVDLYDEPMVGYLGGHYAGILSRVLTDPAVSINHL